jgi:hypothetical protein
VLVQLLHGHGLLLLLLQAILTYLLLLLLLISWGGAEPLGSWLLWFCCQACGSCHLCSLQCNKHRQIGLSTACIGSEACLLQKQPQLCITWQSIYLG